MKITFKYYFDIFVFFQNKTVWHNQGWYNFFYINLYDFFYSLLHYKTLTLEVNPPLILPHSRTNFWALIQRAKPGSKVNLPTGMRTNFRLLSGMGTNLVPGLNPGLKLSLLSGIRPTCVYVQCKVAQRDCNYNSTHEFHSTIRNLP